MRTQTCLILFLGVTLSPCVTRAQTTVMPKDATAVNLLSRAVNVLTQGVAINSVTLMGTVTQTTGDDIDTGSATLEALGGIASRVSLALTNGPQVEIISQSQGAPAGQWSGTDSSVHPMALHNCLTPASWFFPALALAQAINDPSIMITYVGKDTWNDVTVQHVRFWRALPSSTSSAANVDQVAPLAAVDVYLDLGNLLPVALDFNAHPDDNASIDIPIEIQYGGYQNLSGILLPTHIQKLMNYSLFLDINVTSAAINANLSSADFAVAPLQP